MNPLNRLYKQTLYWNIIDSLSNQFLLFIHNLLIRSLAGVDFHGRFSIMFSLFYLLLGLSTSGFDLTISTLWNSAKSKSNLSRLFFQLCIQQTFIFLLLSIIITIAYSAQNLFFKGLIDTFPVTLVLIILAIEMTKKLLKSFLLMTLVTSIPVIIEAIGFIIYLLSIWYWYIFYGYSLTASIVIMSIISLFQIVAFLYYSFEWWHTISLSTDEKESSTSTIWYTRLWGTISQLSNQFFTANFFIPLFAEWCSLSFVSAAKIVSLAAQLLIKFVQRSIGSTIIIMHTKMHAFPYGQFLTHQINNTLYFLVFCSGCMFILLPLTLAQACSLTLNHIFFLTFFLILLTFLEGFFVLYDRLLSVQGKTYFVAAISTVSLASIVIFLQTAHRHDIQTLKFFIILRALGLCFLVLYLVYNLKQSHRDLVRQVFTITTLLIFLTFFIVSFLGK